MGSPLRSPFTVTGSYDTFGFGRRGRVRQPHVRLRAAASFGSLEEPRRAPGLDVRRRDRGRARRGRSRAQRAITSSTPGSRRDRGGRRHHHRRLLLLLEPVPIVHVWPGAATLGPFYHLPCWFPSPCSPRWRSTERSTTCPGWRWPVPVLAMVALTLALVPSKLSDNREVTHDYRAADRVVGGSSRRPSSSSPKDATRGSRARPRSCRTDRTSRDRSSTAAT